ncbi:hypothetical protein KEM52_006723, partial [Ascosphaera acerosa]
LVRRKQAGRPVVPHDWHAVEQVAQGLEGGRQLGHRPVERQEAIGGGDGMAHAEAHAADNAGTGSGRPYHSADADPRHERQAQVRQGQGLDGGRARRPRGVLRQVRRGLQGGHGCDEEERSQRQEEGQGQGQEM